MNNEMTDAPSASSGMGFLTPRTIDEALALAETLARAKLVPAALQDSPADCLLVIGQACRWRLDPLAVAQGTSVVHGKLCYEGKLCHAVLQATGVIQGALRYEYDDYERPKTIRVIGTLAADGSERSISGSVAAWATKNDMWRSDPKKMLAYRGAREWGRMHAPAVMMGFNVADEVVPSRDVDADAVVLPDVTPANVGKSLETANSPSSTEDSAKSGNEPIDVYTYTCKHAFKDRAVDVAKAWWETLCKKNTRQEATSIVRTLCQSYGVVKVADLSEADAIKFCQDVAALACVEKAEDVYDAIAELEVERKDIL